jgi:hypothetical protein
MSAEYFPLCNLLRIFLDGPRTAQASAIMIAPYGTINVLYLPHLLNIAIVMTMAMAILIVRRG